MTGDGIFFDGITSTRQNVTVTLAGAGLQIMAADGRLLAEWPYHELEELNSPDKVLRLGRHGNAVLARLEILNPTFAAAIDLRADNVDRTGLTQRRQRAGVVGWTVAATASLLVVGYFAVPVIAERATPLIPNAIERKLGEAVDIKLRGMLDTQKSGTAFECGGGAREKAGRAAIEKLVGRLQDAAALPSALQVVVVRRNQANAVALPGSKIYVFDGLIAKADNPDEVAGVIAHEIGHIAHRDGTRSVLQASGLSFLFGIMFGDFVGGGAVVLAAKSVLQSSYTRNVEAAADSYGVALMQKAGGNARALGTMLGKIGGATEPGMKILLDHPETKARIAAINKLAPARATKPMLDAGEWTALKRICAG
ncbi:MAG: M48 family metallopeptidase [Pseudolabrys sp.]